MFDRAFVALQEFLFVQYPRANTFMRTDYYLALKDKPKELKKFMRTRFSGYKTLCTFGLGSLFWGSATGVLADWKGSTGLIEYIYIHTIVTFVLLLNGLVASTFHNEAWCAPCVAGFGAWSSLILYLGTAHVMSLKFHDFVMECMYSMIISSVSVTLYWAFSVQDPLPLYILVKTIFWIIGLIIYLVCSIVYLLIVIVLFAYHGTIWGFTRFVVFLSNCCKSVGKDENSLKNRLTGPCCNTRNDMEKTEEDESLGV